MYGHRNLCALCWLKQVNTSRTTEEFCSYWDGLVTEQREQYRAEAERLQQEGTWTKPSDTTASSGTLF